LDKETYRKIIQNFIREKKPNLCCFACGETNPDILEKHHLEGRNNSDRLITLCKNCHAIITAEQNKLPPKTRSKRASPKQKQAYSLITIGALRELSGRKIKEHGFEVINLE
jgi:5-methylcytosine-specific restriction endonuclease McrA